MREKRARFIIVLHQENSDTSILDRGSGDIRGLSNAISLQNMRLLPERQSSNYVLYTNHCAIARRFTTSQSWTLILQAGVLHTHHTVKTASRSVAGAFQAAAPEFRIACCRWMRPCPARAGIDDQLLEGALP